MQCVVRSPRCRVPDDRNTVLPFDEPHFSSPVVMYRTVECRIVQQCRVAASVGACRGSMGLFIPFLIFWLGWVFREVWLLLR
ncbi:unnamed protein product [Urochloa humidicola]